MQTPHQHTPELAKALGCDDLYLKREDLHQYGSHKGRSIPVMIDHYFTQGDRSFVISSSGNAALAAALYIKELHTDPSKKGLLSLDIYVGKHVAPHKLAKLKELSDEHIRVLIKERPLQALTQATQEGVRSLRQSTDDTALLGYQSLAEELAVLHKENKVGTVFIGTSSGTTAQALSSYFLKKKLPIQVHIVQTSACHPMTEAFDPVDTNEDQSLADAIVDKTAYRKPALIPLIEKTGGRGWSATNEDIRVAMELADKHLDFTISPNSALSIVGAMQAIYTGWDMEGAIALLICGE